MAAAASATAIALIIAYLFYYALHLLATFGKGGVKTTDVQERGNKLYLYAIIALLSIHFVTTFAAVFAWITLITLGAYLYSAFLVEEKKKALAPIFEIAYISSLLIWWIGETAAIFNLNVVS